MTLTNPTLRAVYRPFFSLGQAGTEGGVHHRIGGWVPERSNRRLPSLGATASPHARKMTTVVKTDEWFVVRAIARFEPAADSEMALAKNEEVVARYYSEHGSWMKAARLGDGGNVVDSGLIPASFVRLLNVRPFFVFVFFSDSFFAFFPPPPPSLCARL